MEIRTLPIDLKAMGDGSDLTAGGYVNVTGSISEVLRNKNNGKKFRETIAPGVFQEAIEKAEHIDFLMEHNRDKILSTTENGSLSLAEDPMGLFMSANISPTTWGKDAYQLIVDGIIQGMSFGMSVLDERWSINDDGLPLRIITAISLFEVSAVRHPAYKSSNIETRGIEQIDDVEIPEIITEEKNTEVRTVEEKKEQEVIEVAEPKGEEPSVEVEEAPKVEDENKSEEPVAEELVTEERSAEEGEFDLKSYLDEMKNEILDAINGTEERSAEEAPAEKVETVEAEIEEPEEVKEEIKNEEPTEKSADEIRSLTDFFVGEIENR